MPYQALKEWGFVRIFYKVLSSLDKCELAASICLAIFVLL
jgi:hypothetical protein